MRPAFGRRYSLLLESRHPPTLPCALLYAALAGRGSARIQPPPSRSLPSSTSPSSRWTGTGYSATRPSSCAATESVEIGPAGRVKVPEDGARVDGRGEVAAPRPWRGARARPRRPGGRHPVVGADALSLCGGRGHHHPGDARTSPSSRTARSRAARGPAAAARPCSCRRSLVQRQHRDHPRGRREDGAGTESGGVRSAQLHPGLKLEVFEALARTAREAGIRFAGHVPQEVGLAALSRGILDHRASRRLCRGDGAGRVAGGPGRIGVLRSQPGRTPDESKLPELVRATKQAGVWNVPTEI